MPPRRSHASGRRRSSRAGWCRIVASFTLAALLFPSLGALPWIGADLTSVEAAEHEHHRTAAADSHDALHEDAGEHDHDLSDVPGSPLHPVDHDCFPCQVLACLSRCALLPPAVPVVAIVPPRPLRPPPVVVTPRVTMLAAVLPPVRAPPAANI
ncbi:MAG TPA: hypothetical protein VFJ68_14490 [Casimicrobiaceae bacterium]|nr:hypothetical protein [Casimicrobiaceae bacterium]